MTDDNRARALEEARRWLESELLGPSVLAKMDELGMNGLAESLATAILDAERRGAEKERERATFGISCAFCGKEGHDGAQCPNPKPGAVDAWAAWRSALRTPVPGTGGDDG